MAAHELSDDEERAHAMNRVAILDAITLAIERRAEVLEVIASSSSADIARAAVSGLLGVSDVGAMAILDLQWFRFAALERGRINFERDELRRYVDRRDGEATRPVESKPSI